MIKNKTKNKILTKEKRMCNSMISKATGLMFSKKNKDQGLIFTFNKTQKMSLHMLFVFYPIDVLFLDEKNKVVEIKENFSPFTFYTAKNKSKTFIELNNGLVKKTKTEVGDEILY
ncbi:MAG: DUF192 domain-containing protein [Nanoarchaeota archaeon]|nr:DUF192 domain-containing protein [Nanoarchaeota archaeon]MBU1029610.1 DUF192 domain-containing protein [Nanoarchaeota archaeon]MBU1850237.1 DUF192 domain-containing protein [Nanoarchaeota archaeon]